MPAPDVDARRVIADLRELAERTSDDAGAQRTCWTEGWRRARDHLRELVGELGLVAEQDEAGNMWARLEGTGGDRALALGSHLDSVPGGGWLDGALGVLAGVGVLRAWARSDRRPPRDVLLVDWADEEGARFGRSLFGSSAFAGTLDVAAVRDLRDRDGVGLVEALAANGVELERVRRCASRREGIGMYLELHIEQGPVLEAEGTAVAAVDGCAGVERRRFTIGGQAAHAGTTPMGARRDAALAAADAALRIEAVGRDSGGVATTGALALEPGIATAVPGRAELTVDLRHPAADALTAMLARTREAVRAAAGARGCGVDEEFVWSIEPVGFDATLVEAARSACRATTGSERVLGSGALHDAAAVARVLPAAMVFVPSRAGLSHAKEEDTAEDDLVAGIETFAALAGAVLEAV